MTRRLDRPEEDIKLHLQSLCAPAHFDFNAQGAYSYEQALQIMRELRLPYTDAVSKWPAFAKEAGVNRTRIQRIELTHRLSL